jgi:actin-like ATPase involved in cell morphogenesis
MAAGTGYAVGIDLGTTFTAAAVASGGRAEIVALGHTSAVVPSVVLVRADGDVLIGEAAERRASSEPTRVGREFKRRLGDPVPLVLGGTPFGAEALTAHLLRSVYDRVVEQQGAVPDAVVITHPANYGEYKLDLVREAIRLADVPNVQLLSEPEAAATHYGEQDRLEEGDVVAVYDFGGGTFDAAVLRVGATGLEILGTPEGMERLGGIDFDQAVYAHVMTMLGDVADDLNATDPATASALARLRDECREAKEALSSDTDADVPVLLPNLHTEVRLTRPEFEAMIRPRISETIQSLERAIRSAGLETSDVDKVLLVGGSSRIPLVAEMVAASTGRPVATDAHPKHAIAIGAALHAARAGGIGPAGVAASGIAAGATTSTAGAMPPPVVPGPAGPATGAHSDDDAAESPRRRTGLLIGAAIAAIALVVGALVVFSGGDDAADSTEVTGSDNAVEAPGTTSPVPETTAAPTTEAAVIVTAGEIILEPLAAETDDAFTESVAAEPSPELLAFAADGGRQADDSEPTPTTTPSTTDEAGPTTLISRNGTDPGLYGATRDEATCDPELLMMGLDERPAEAAAWADVHEIDVDEIAGYVALLTPLNLTADTRVTNHGFIDGVAVPRQSVLQVGTAVMVDEFGVPRVRCSSGSPLLPPNAVEGVTRYTGAAWDTFSPAATVVVAPAPDSTIEFVVFDVVAGDEFVRPVGSNGAADRAVLPGEVEAIGEFVSFPDYTGPFDVNEIRMIFRPEGGDVVATFDYALTVQGITIAGDGDLTGTFNPVSNLMSGTGFGTVNAGGVAGGSGSGDWTAIVDPLAGTVNGSAGDADGRATFLLTFEPYAPPS